MLVYHPAYDAYHCVFRSLQIVRAVNVIELTKLRILDFYFCFPSELKRIRLPSEHSEARKIAKEAQNEYHGPVSMQQTFRDMEHIQLAALRTLAASRLLDTAEFETGLIRRTKIDIPSGLQAALDKAAEENRAVLDYITQKLCEIPLLGENGLKHRTGLMEYRYDNA